MDSEVENTTINGTEEVNGTNLTGRDAATAEGIVITYSSLFLLALGPIFIGSVRSVAYHCKLRVSHTPTPIVTVSFGLQSRQL